jgi:hypothetical protein
MTRSTTACVLTTIFAPTEAVRQFAAISDLKLIVVGDKKTPTDWACPEAIFLSADHQDASDFSIARFLPWNHYCRKMFGYLEAIRIGSEIIYETDDDNFPLSNWYVPVHANALECVLTTDRYVNIYRAFTDQQIWPRGFPLRLVNAAKNQIVETQTRDDIHVGIWQGLANGDPDVDAVYRLTSNVDCVFRERGPLVLPEHVICPFNSQNTFFHRNFFALMYLPSTVTFRFTDILRGLVAQPILWSAGSHLGFMDATVQQARNPHDYLKDFVQEVPMYLHTEDVVDIACKHVTPHRSVEENLRIVYEVLAERGIVDTAELLTLDAWLNDVDALR